MATEELVQYFGREGMRLHISGTFDTFDGNVIVGSEWTSKTVTIYDIDSGELILDHEDDTGVTGLTVSEVGVWEMTVKSTWMTVVNTELRVGNHERHRVLMEFSNGTEGADWHHEVDVLVRKVANLG